MMLPTEFDYQAPHPYVCYGRMSSDAQNERSPDQQFVNIEATVRRLGYPWKHVRNYRDGGVSGQFVRKRADFTAMLADIKEGRVKVDLILVDTIERFGRNERTPELIRQLHTRHGVLVLCADNSFTDPTSVSGRALGLLQQMRATDDTRIKSHNVKRGKRDAVLLRRWPGGRPPFGFRIETIFKSQHGRSEINYAILKPDSETSWIIKLLFAKAAETGWGPCRLAQFLNEHPDIPETLRKFSTANVGLWLQTSIYMGRYEWGKRDTGVVDDRRVHRAKNAADWIVVDDYCEPLVERDVWDAVQKLVQIRAAAHKRREKVSDDGKFITPLSRGMVVNYPLSGLVRCDLCGRAMILSSSSATNAQGELRRYDAYRCPASASKQCENHTGIPENWLRAAVLEDLLERLQLTAGRDNEDVLAEVVSLVNSALQRKMAERPNLAPSLESERAKLERQMNGWSQSLADPELEGALRRKVQNDWAAAHERTVEIETYLAEEKTLRQGSTVSADREAVQNRLTSLSEAISGENATWANFHLAQHIDSIRCLPDRQVILRVCKLGMLPDVSQLLARLGAEPNTLDNLLQHRRRRAPLAVDCATECEEDALHFAMDPDRFAELGTEWFWTSELSCPPSVSWSEEHAREVAEYRLATKNTMPKTAAHFDMSVPTIRVALKIAKERYGLDALGKELSLPTRPNWPRDHALEVAEFMKRPGVTQRAAALHFNKCTTWIKKAIDIAATLGDTTATTDSTKPPDDQDGEAA